MTTQPDRGGVRISSVRSTVIEALVDVVTTLGLGHPTPVGIDSRSAAGKTTLANELAATIQLHGPEVLRAELDDLSSSRPQVSLDAWRRTPNSYYAESYDYAAVRQMLEPVGPGGNLRCRTRLSDSYHDVSLPEEWHCPPGNAMVLGEHVHRVEGAIFPGV